MAIQSPFFPKRDATGKTEPVSPVTPSPAQQGTATPGAAPRGGNLFGTASPSSSAGNAAAAPAPSFAAALAPVAETVQQTVEPKGSKLTVGPNIKLKGVEITDCDTLFIEGVVEATIDSRVIQISEHGSFNGTANIDVAEIRGSFEGALTVREKLTVHSSGKVKGKIVYGKLVVEEGADISGEISSSVNK